MKCKKFEEDITRFVYDSLPDHKEKTLMEHIRTCPGCKQMLQKSNIVRNSLNEIELGDEEIFIKKTMSRIKDLQQRKFSYTFKSIFSDSLRNRRWIAYSTTILLVLIIFYFVLGIHSIFKQQKADIQKVLIKSELLTENVKVYHIKDRYITYLSDDERRYKIETWFKSPYKYGAFLIIYNLEYPYIKSYCVKR